MGTTTLQAKTIGCTGESVWRGCLPHGRGRDVPRVAVMIAHLAPVPGVAVRPLPPFGAEDLDRVNGGWKERLAPRPRRADSSLGNRAILTGPPYGRHATHRHDGGPGK